LHLLKVDYTGSSESPAERREKMDPLIRFAIQCGVIAAVATVVLTVLGLIVKEAIKRSRSAGESRGEEE
jgi:hypothetical protein